MKPQTNFSERTIEYEKLLMDFKSLLKKNGLKLRFNARSFWTVCITPTSI